MTGKFTENVHNLGYATGSLLRRLLLSTTDPTSSSPTASCISSTAANFTQGILVGGSKSISDGISSLPTTLSELPKSLIALPNRYRIWWLDLLHSDPLHVLVETLLIVMCITLVVLQRRADWRFSQERKKSAPTDEEAEELLKEWKEKRKPLGSSGSHGSVGSFSSPVKKGKKGSAAAAASSSAAVASPTKVGTGLVVEKIRGSKLFFQNDKSDKKVGKPAPSSALNFATLDYLSTSSSSTLRRVATTSLAHYGCGSCGPRGFYGTIDAHLEAEVAVSEFLGTEGAILYSDGASASTSTVAAFAKRGDLLIVDEGVNEALLVGVTLSRANVRYFRHNDVKDLRRVLEKVAQQDETLKRQATDQRRFLVVEGLYRNWGTIAPLKEIVALKEEFHYRLILDDSHGIGTLGETGRGTLEHHGLKPMFHAEILTFSLENALGSVGGMTVGSEEVVDHQRLSGAGYCFSASAPPFLSKVCVASIQRIEGKLDEVTFLTEEAENEGEANAPEKEETSGSEEEKLNIDGMKVDELKAELKKRGLPVSGRKAELQQRLTEHISPNNSSSEEDEEELSGPTLLSRLHQNVSNLYTTLTNSSHPHALKLRNRLVITSDPESPIVYLRLAEEQAKGRTFAEQTAILDNIAEYCLVDGKVAMVSTGGHVTKYLQLVPEPCLRLVANASQTQGDVEVLIKALGEGVERVLVRNEGNVME